MPRNAISRLLSAGSLAALAAAAQAQDIPGFAISIDGETVAGDASVARQAEARRAPVPEAAAAPAAPTIAAPVAKARVRVQYDGLGAEPVLALSVLEAPDVAAPGARVRVASRLNYPAYAARAEIVVLAERAGRLRVAQRVPVAPGGEAVLTLPEGDRFALVHRVYDARGRYDETHPIGLGASADVPASGLSDMARVRRIPAHGGTVVVSGEDVRPGAAVTVLGEPVAADASGAFVVDRILPPGEVPVSVSVQGVGEDSYVEHIVTVPRAEWFGVGIADVTFGKRFDPGVTAAGVEHGDTFSYGRLAGYARGRTASGWTITTRFDSGEEELDELFESRDDRDPASVLERLDYDEEGYSEFGDDSLIVDGAPSRGKFYGRIERGGSHLMWGDFQAGMEGGRLLRDTRQLYGAQGVYVAPGTTAAGEPRLRIEGYAASPERLPARDVLRGTGGSIYFLSQQDLAVASERVSIEIRDLDTDRIVSSTPLTEGADYDVNYIQGVILLDRPLSGTVDGAEVVDRAGGRYAASLVVQYEYTPVAGDVDGTNFGLRAEGWAGSRLRFGVTGSVERTGTADQTAAGADALLVIGQSSALSVEIARTEGPGFGASVSGTGGLDFASVDPLGGTGGAVSARLDLDFADLGLAGEGRVGAYYDGREAGFSTLDQQIATDQEAWGVDVEMAASETLSWRLYHEGFDDADGSRIRETGAELGLRAGARLRFDLGIERLERTEPGEPDETGSRTDVALRAAYAASPALDLYAFGQVTADRDGGLEANDRAGIGAEWALSDRWALSGELSDGSQGPGGRLFASYDDGGRTTGYLGYELDPGREISGVDLIGEDAGRVIAGGTRRLNDYLGLRAERSFDLFGEHRSVATTYGVDWTPAERLTFDLAAETGRIDDTVNGDIDRDAISIGAAWSDGEALAARARVELRRDRAEDAALDQDAVLLTGRVDWTLDDAQRLRFEAEYADIDSEAGTLAEGRYAQVGLGYALRPVLHDRWNALFQYRYLSDEVGQRVDGVAGAGPVQRSHVLSVDIEHDIGRQWSVGGKIGARFGESAPAQGLAFEDNDAWLALANARWHVVKNWDALIEARHLRAEQGGFAQTGLLGAVYRHVGPNAKIGVGYNLGEFSDDLADLTYDEQGAFVNVIAKF